MTKQESNLMIAKFMGLKELPNGYIRYGKDWHETIPVSNLMYDNSFDELMEVVEKIEGQGCIIEIWLSLGRGCKILRPTEKQIICEDNSTITAIYNAVVEYINWYNKKYNL